MKIRTCLLPWVLAALACGEDTAPPRPQWLVVVTTDAVVPLMGDRLRVELLDQEGNLACPSCRREAEVVPEDKWPVSFGIASPTSATEVYVRAQLYRSDRVIAPTRDPDDAVINEGGEGSRTTLDFLGVLPTLKDGVNQVGVHLVADCLGKPVTGTLEEGFLACSSAPWTLQPPPTLGPPRQDLEPNGGVGTTHLMPSEEHLRCPDEVPEGMEGMVCIPGGLFFMGSALAPVPSKDVRAVSYPQRLVAIRSFFMDQYEVTVGEFKAARTSEVDCAQKVPEAFCRDESDPNSKALHCTFSPLSSEFDDLPINCVSWEAAQAHCAASGKRLPTEVEWEYAATNGMKETRHPWGNEPPQCDSAHVARGIDNWKDNIDCRTLETVDGPVPPTDSNADETVIHERSDLTVYGLAGNVSEWTKNRFSAYSPEPKDVEDPRCWDPNEGPLLNLVDSMATWCEHVPPGQPPPPEERIADTTRMSLRGGAWRDSLQSTWSASRNSASANSRIPRPEIGFRCVRDIEP